MFETTNQSMSGYSPWCSWFYLHCWRSMPLCVHDCTFGHPSFRPHRPVRGPHGTASVFLWFPARCLRKQWWWGFFVARHGGIQFCCWGTLKSVERSVWWWIYRTIAHLEHEHNIVPPVKCLKKNDPTISFRTNIKLNPASCHETWPSAAALTLYSRLVQR